MLSVYCALLHHQRSWRADLWSGNRPEWTIPVESSEVTVSDPVSAAKLLNIHINELI